MALMQKEYLYKLEKLLRCSSGNFAIMAALLLPVLLVAAGGAVDLANAYSARQDLQQRLDGGTLAAALTKDQGKRKGSVERFLATATGVVQNSEEMEHEKGQFGVQFSSQQLAVVTNKDGSVTSNLTIDFGPSFLSMIGMNTISMNVTSTAYAEFAEVDQTCIHVLGDVGQAVLINSGAKLKSTKCGVNVHSTKDPAYIMNSGSSVETKRFCVKGTKRIDNGGVLTNVEHGCAVSPDPMAGKIPTPTIPKTCTTQNKQNGPTHSLKAGMHCSVGFDSKSKITFEPGLHIIKGMMTIDDGSTITGNGVTFYFVDTDATIRANGNLTATLKAPTSGTYKDILMFEVTKSSSNMPQYIFNGSQSEKLEGAIYLPNRQLVFNSTTNQDNKLLLVAKSLIVNSANWKIQPLDSMAGSGTAGKARLIR